MAEAGEPAFSTLKQGDRGPDVARVQRELLSLGAPLPITPNGIFEATTEAAVRWFQKARSLVEDGQVGAITRAVLFHGSFVHKLPRPPWVRQGALHLCWAASLESVFRGAWPGRPKLTVAELQDHYRSLLTFGGAIDPAGLRRIGQDWQFGEILAGRKLRAEDLLRYLRTRRPILLVDNSTGSIMHTRVIYGIEIKRGWISLLLMDPLAGYTAVPLPSISNLTQLGLLAPNEATPRP